MPDKEPTVASEVLVLDHDPPGPEFDSVIVEPVQTAVGPEVVPGAGVTETGFVT